MLENVGIANEQHKTNLKKIYIEFKFGCFQIYTAYYKRILFVPKMVAFLINKYYADLCLNHTDKYWRAVKWNFLN